MKNNKGISLISLVIVIIIIVLLIGLMWIGILILKNVAKDNTDNMPTVYTNNNERKEGGLADKKMSELVYDAKYDKEKTDYNFEYYAYEKNETDGLWKINYNNVKIAKLSNRQYPYINLESDDADAVNIQIKEMYLDYEDSFIVAHNMAKEAKQDEDWETLFYVYGDTIANEDAFEYKSYKKDNILSVMTKQTAGLMYFAYNTWTFDLNTQKLMKFEDVCNKLGYTSQQVKNELKNQVTQNIKEFSKEAGEEQWFDEINEYTGMTPVEYTMQTYDKSVKNNDIKYFVDNDGKLNIIVDTQIPFEREHYEFVYSIK